MRKSAILKILGILCVLSILLMDSVWSIPARAERDEPFENKISSLLSMHIKMKLEQAEINDQSTMISFGMDSQSTCETTLVNRERVYLHFVEQPTLDQMEDLKSLGVTVYSDTWIPPVSNFKTGYVLADIQVNMLSTLSEKNYIMQLDTAEQVLSSLNDGARAVMDVDPVWRNGYTGAGVTVAVLDSSLDSSNLDFPTPIAAIDYSNYPNIDNTIGGTVTGHGTHVTGSLLGRGVNSALYKGVAPGADLIFIKVGNDSDGLVSSSAVVYAIRDAVDIYQAKIINFSYGNWSEYHDGTDQVCQAVDYATDHGATVFVAAGNSASSGWHYSGTISAGGTTDYIPITVATGSTSMLPLNMVWYDGLGAHNNLSLKYYNSSRSLLQSSDGVQSESILGTESIVSQLDNTASSGSYYIKIHNNSSGSQFFHIYYSGGLSAVTFTNPDQNYTIASPAEADSAIAVGAYVTRNDWTNYKGYSYNYNPIETIDSIASFSSRGPRVDAEAPEKPDIVAPGSAIISVRDSLYALNNINHDPAIIDDDGLQLNGSGPANYFVMEGTSMACPMAAGVGALLLSKDPTLTPAEVKQLITSTATHIGSSGWNNIYGNGLINASSALSIKNLFNGSIVFSSDISSAAYKIYTVNTNGSNQRLIFSDGSDDRCPRWSPDGTKIAFCSAKVTGNNIYVIDANGTNLVQLTNTSSANFYPAWSPDGKKIAYTCFLNGNGQIYIMNSDGSQKTRITSNTHEDIKPSWSPDGTKIVFTSFRDRNWEIYSMNADGSNQTRLTNNSVTDDEPSWSPDGTKIVYTSFKNSHTIICLMNADGSNQVAITSNYTDWNPTWSPDGTNIAFVSNRTQPPAIYLMDINGNFVTRINHQNGTSGGYYEPSWSFGFRSAPKVETDAASNIKSTSGILNGSLIDNGTSAEVKVSFDWGIDSSYTGGNLEGIPQSLSEPGIFNANLTGLSPGMTYHFRAKAVGDSIVFGDDAVFTTGLLKLNFICEPQIVIAGSSSEIITLQVQDDSGNPINVKDDTLINLTSSSSNGRFSDNTDFSPEHVIGSIMISQNSNSASFYYKDTFSGTHTITASSSGYIDGTQQITIIAAAAAQVRVETRDDGSGNSDPRNVTAGRFLTVYAIARDAYGNFVENASGNWSLENKTGMVDNTDLVASAGSPSAVFTGHKIGSANIRVVSGTLTSFDFGTITVVPKFSVTGYPSSAVAGTPETITVTAQDGNGATIIDYSGIAHFTSSDLQANLPDNYEFLSEDNGSHHFSITLKTASSNQFIVATDTLVPEITGSQTDIEVLAAEASQVRAETRDDGSGNSDPQNVTAGSSLTVYAIARDAYGNFVENASGNWSLENKTGMVDNTDLVASAGSPSAVFTGHKIGSANIRVITDDLSSVDSGLFTVVPGVASILSVSGFPSTIDVNVAGNVTVTAKDSYDNTVTEYEGTVHFISSDNKASLPSNYTFTSSNKGTHTFPITFKTIGTQSIMVTDLAIGSITGSQGSITVKAATSTGGGGGGGGGSGPKIYTVNTTGLTCSTALCVDKYGIVLNDVQVGSDNGNVGLNITKDTKMTYPSGLKLDKLTITKLTAPPAAPDKKTILVAYEFGPEGAKFNPNLTLTIKYDPKALAEGCKLELAYWDKTQWVGLDSQINNEVGTISTLVTHFSQYALLVEPPPPSAKFKISEIKLSADKVQIDEKVTIQVDVTNVGNGQGQYSLVLKVNDQEEGKREGALEVNQSHTLSFEVSRSVPGEYTLLIGDRAAMFTVLEPPSPTPEDKPISQTMIPQSVPTVTPPVIQLSPPPSTTSPGPGVPIFLTLGLVIVALAVVIGVILYRRTKR